jgi:hypothetical protein
MVELYASLTFTTHENALTVLKTRLRGREETKLRVVVKIFLMIRACRTRQYFDRRLTVNAYDNK